MRARVHALTIVRVRKEEAYIEASLNPTPEPYYTALKACFPEIREMDRKRKDKGRLEKPDHSVSYQIDLEAFGYLLYTDKDYPEDTAQACLTETVKAMSSISEYEHEEKASLQQKFAGKANSLLRKYADPGNVSQMKGMFGEMGDRLSEATQQMKNNLKLAMQNNQLARETDEKAGRSKLIAQELQTDTEGLGSQDGWNQNKLYVLGGVGLFVLVLIVIAFVAFK